MSGYQGASSGILGYSQSYHANYSQGQHQNYSQGYSGYPTADKSRLLQLEKDNKDLSQAIEELNGCYTQKIRIMEDKISDHQKRCEELLEWKKEHIDKSLFEVERYELEIKKMIDIMDNAHRNFEKKKEEMEKVISSQSEDIQSLKEENYVLRAEREQIESHIEELEKANLEKVEQWINGQSRKDQEQSHGQSREDHGQSMNQDQENTESNVNALKDISNMRSFTQPLSEKSLKLTTFGGNENVLEESLNA